MGGDRRAAIERPADTVEARAQAGPARSGNQWFAMQAYTDIGNVEPGCRLEHLDDHGIPVDRHDAPEPLAAVGARDIDSFVQPDIDIAAQGQQRSLDGTGRPAPRSAQLS